MGLILRAARAGMIAAIMPRMIRITVAHTATLSSTKGALIIEVGSSKSGLERRYESSDEAAHAGQEVNATFSCTIIATMEEGFAPRARRIPISLCAL